MEINLDARNIKCFSRTPKNCFYKKNIIKFISKGG